MMHQQLIEWARTRRWAIVAWVVLAGTGLTTVPPVSASTVLALPEAELTQRADAVVFGVVLSTRVLGSEKGFISTEADIQIYDRVKGPKVGSVIKVQVPGGTWRGLVAVVPGSVTLKVGQMWVGFLNQKTDVVYTSWGMGFGLVPVHRGTGGALIVGRNGYDAAVVAPEGADVHGMLQIGDTPLPEYMARLREHVAEVETDPTDPIVPGTTVPGGGR